MMSEDGFDITLEETDVSFLNDNLRLRVVKVIKFGEDQMVPKELAEDPKFLAHLIEEVKNRIDDRVNCVK